MRIRRRLGHDRNWMEAALPWRLQTSDWEEIRAFNRREDRRRFIYRARWALLFFIAMVAGLVSLL